MTQWLLSVLRLWLGHVLLLSPPLCTQDQSLLTGNSMDVHLGCSRKVLREAAFELNKLTLFEKLSINMCLSRFSWRFRLCCVTDP